MKILYVVARPLEINTSASVRNRATILGLLENGHDVEILTTAPDSKHSAYDKNMGLSDTVPTTYIHLTGVQSLSRFGHRLKLLKSLRHLAYRFLMKHEIYDNLKSMANHTRAVSLKTRHYDLIISSSDPKSSHLFVSTLLQQQGSYFHGKWIQIWGDPFAGDITLKAKNKVGLIRKEEHRLLLQADKVVYVSELTKIAQQEMYPDCAEKMFSYPIPYMEERITSTRDLQTAEQIRLVYCGDYVSTTRNIMPLYEAVRQMPNVSLTVCGLSDLHLANCENIRVLPRTSYDKVCRLEDEADILVHLSNLRGSQIPGKIYQYSGTNKPILFILDGDTSALLGCFSPYARFTFTENTTGAIENTLEWAKHDTTKYAPLSNFNKLHIAEQIVSMRLTDGSSL